jgi:uncharacterized cysteine cluster protein YcgN (CxxCxxCC family)
LDTKPFWKSKTLDDLSPSEWERLCDGCGRCCLVKLEDEDNGDIYLTRLACSLLDLKTCRCSDYAARHEKMPDCISITPEMVRTLGWLPPTCAYRRVEEGKDLLWWHPLISGSCIRPAFQCVSWRAARSGSNRAGSLTTSSMISWTMIPPRRARGEKNPNDLPGSAGYIRSTLIQRITSSRLTAAAAT